MNAEQTPLTAEQSELLGTAQVRAVVETWARNFKRAGSRVGMEESDLISEGFIAASDAIRTTPTKRSFESWVAMFVIRRLCSLTRTEDGWVEINESTATVDPSERDTDHDLAALKDAIARLDADEAAVVRLHHLEGMGFAAIASRRGCSTTTIWRIAQRGMAKLRKDLGAAATS